jgi:hypothetical protein
MSKLAALFIDPYKMRVDPILIENSLQAWYATMCCQSLDVVRLGLIVNDLKIDLWSMAGLRCVSRSHRDLR